MGSRLRECYRPVLAEVVRKIHQIWWPPFTHRSSTYQHWLYDQIDCYLKGQGCVSPLHATSSTHIVPGVVVAAALPAAAAAAARAAAAPLDVECEEELLGGQPRQAQEQGQAHGGHQGQEVGLETERTTYKDQQGPYLNDVYTEGG